MSLKTYLKALHYVRYGNQYIGFPNQYLSSVRKLYRLDFLNAQLTIQLELENIVEYLKFYYLFKNCIVINLKEMAEYLHVRKNRYY